MGNLHTLRRAIERDPKIWTVYGNSEYPCGAYRARGRAQWLPCWSKSYRKFVGKVLKDIDAKTGRDNLNEAYRNSNGR